MGEIEMAEVKSGTYIRWECQRLSLAVSSVDPTPLPAFHQEPVVRLCKTFLLGNF